MVSIILGIVMVVYAWMHLAYGMMQKHKNDARAQWIRVNALLKTRSDYILKLLALLSDSGFEDRELLAEIYELDGGYSQSDDREVVSAKAESVTPLLDQIFVIVKKFDQIIDNKEIQELISELFDIEDNIIFESAKYNKSIDLYNVHREKPSLKLQVAILGATKLKGFYIRQFQI